MERILLSQPSHHGRGLLNACLIACILLTLYDTSVANDEPALAIESTEVATARKQGGHGDTPDIVQQDIPESVNFDLVGRWIGGACNSIAQRDGIAFCGVGGGLIIVDFTSPGAPVELSRVVLPGGCGSGTLSDVCKAVDVNGDYAYVADFRGGLRIIYVADTSSPREVGHYDLGNYATGVAVSGDYAYVANGNNGLRVIDVSDPEHPREVGTLDALGFCYDVTVNGVYAYVGSTSGLHVVDISAPSTPIETGFWPKIIDVARSVTVHGNYAYVAAGFDGVRVIEVSDPTNPVEVGAEDTPMRAIDVVIGGDYAYVADTGAFRVVDVSDPTNPQAVKSLISRNGLVQGLAISGDIIYLANGRRGARTLDVSDPTDPKVLGTHPTGDLTGHVIVNQGYAFVAEGNEGVWALDISDPSAPVEVGSHDFPGAEGPIAISDHHAYVGNGSVLRVLDVSDPANMAEVGSWNAYSVADIEIVGPYLYVANSFAGFRVLDISDPTTPIEVGAYDTDDYATAVAVSENYAYVAANKAGVRVFDVSDPTNPQEVGAFITGTDEEPSNVVVNGGYAYVISRVKTSCCDVDGSMRVLDISDPAAPVEVYRYLQESGGTFGDIAVGRDYVFVGDHGGLRALDVTNALAPEEAGFCWTGSGASGITLSDGLIYMADGLTGLHILRHTPETLAVALDIKPGSCPNPLNTEVPRGAKTNGGVLPVAILGSNEIDVHDIDVSSLELAGAAPLRHSYKDVATPPNDEEDCACSEKGPDGHTDLALKFRRLDVVAGLGSASGQVSLTLTGQMKDGTPIEGTDCVRIVPKKGGGGPQLTLSEAAAATALGTATPNPFNPTTTIAYELSTRGHVTLSVYEVTGRLVAALVDGEMPAGRHQVSWEAKGIASGVYFYRMQAGTFVQTRKMVLLK